MHSSELMIFKDENGQQMALTDFKNNIKLEDDKVLIIKYTYVAVPTKKQNILMITEREETDNKFGVGKIIAVAANITSLKVNTYVLFNKWNNCLEFHNNNNIYYVVKATEVHAALNMTPINTENNTK